MYIVLFTSIFMQMYINAFCIIEKKKVNLSSDNLHGIKVSTHLYSTQIVRNQWNIIIKPNIVFALLIIYFK